MSKQGSLRIGRLEDLDAFVRLEKAGFASDQFSRKQLRYLLTRAHATTFVVEQKGQVQGAAIMLWRRDSPVGRLYSIVTHPAFQGQGLGSMLLRACEDAAAQRGCTEVSLEVRADNRGAIALYERHGYRVNQCLPGFYADGANGLRMSKILETEGAEVRLEVPYYAQTLEFTCGPACLMMAMKYFDPSLVLNRSLELMLWKEATLIFMTSGLGGCGPFGLGVAAQRRNYQTRVIISDQQTPFLSSVRSPVKKEVIRVVHEQLKEEAGYLGVGSEYFNFTFEDIARAMRDGAVPIVLISTYRLHRVRAPHWVVLTGFDNRDLFFHDPYEGFYMEDKRQAQDVRISIQEFRRMRRYGKDIQKSVLFVARARKAPEAHT